MTKKKIEQSLIDNTRQGCFAARKSNPEKLDPQPICDIVGGGPDTLASALDRINRGSMTYEEFQTLHGGDFDYDDDDAIPDDFDEGEFYEAENDSGAYYDRDKESRILASESRNDTKNDKQEGVADKSDSSDKGDE